MGACLLRGLVGSAAYGLDRPGSDRDYLAVHLAPLRDVLGLQGPHAVESTVVDHGPDCTSFELAKFCRLALKANPTVLELLWLAHDSYTHITPSGLKLLELRGAFLSDRARDTYRGYARQQARRLLERGGTFSADLARRTNKHGRHCARLLLQGSELLRTGQLVVRLNDGQVLWCNEMGDLAEHDPARFAQAIEDIFGRFDTTTSVLPPEPDTGAVDAFVVAVRQGAFEMAS